MFFFRGLGKGKRLGTHLRLFRKHFDLVQRIQHLGFGDLLYRLRLFLSQRITQVLQTLLGHIENQVALRPAVFRQSLQVVLDAGDRIRQGVQALPVRHSLAGQQLVLNVAVTSLQQRCGTLQRNHGQPATDLSQQIGNARQVLVIPLRGDELDDRILRLFQPVARFANNQLVNLSHIGGRQMIRFAALLRRASDHAGERSLDIEQCSGDIHQHGVVGRLPSLRNGLDQGDLVENDLARLREAEHRQGIGDLLERHFEARKLGNDLAIAAHEQVKTVLHADQFFAQCRDHRAHRASVRASQLGAFLINHGAVRQRFIEAIVLLERLDARRLPGRLGDIEEQILDQLIRRSLVDTICALLDQPLELLVHLSQQGANRCTVAYTTTGQPFDQPRRDLPERSQRRILAKLFQAGKYPSHIAQIGRKILVADHAHQCDLQHLAQLAQQCRELLGAQALDGLARKRRGAPGEIGREKAGFREQLFATGGTQIIEQRQDDHRQVATGALDAIQIDGKLQDGLHHHLERFALVGHAAFEQRTRELLHFLGEQCRAEELDHLQSAMYLMHIGQAKAHPSRVLWILDERLQRLTRLLKRFGNLAFHPLQGDIIVPITHSDSAHKLFRVKART